MNFKLEKYKKYIMHIHMLKVNYIFQYIKFVDAQNTIPMEIVSKVK